VCDVLLLNIVNQTSTVSDNLGFKNDLFSIQERAAYLYLKQPYIIHQSLS